MTDTVPVLEDLLGERLVAYHRESERTMLRFADGTIISFEGYHSYPTSDEALQAIWAEKDGWIESEDEDDD